MVLFLLGRGHTSHRDAGRDSLEETMNAGLIKRSCMLDVDVGATAPVKLLIKSFDSAFNSLILVLWFPGWDVPTVTVCSSVSQNTAVNCLHLCYMWEAAGLNILLAN